MNAERWHHVKTLLDEALDRPPGERAAFLDEACQAGDAALRAEVESLLAAYDEETVSFLSEGAFGADVRPPQTEPLEEGARIGPYRLTGLLGRGGMGTVYCAVRADGQHAREVALKVIRPGLYVDEVVQRFRAERQILASLEHPHIARLYDGGLTSGGRPYFAMERVEGTPLDCHCDAKKCSIEERLHLFEKAAGAVAHAHRRLVVHRDLKPANILIDAEGEPKLLDFGIAKLLDAEAPGAAPLTRTGQPLMTPEYAAPEQVRGEAVTPATDVYALGVVLYQLLTGRRPYRFEQRTPSHIERVVCETQPVRPSAVVTRSADGANEADEPTTAGVASPRRLKRRLKGDLDRIIMKALRKEPARRYATAAELAGDLRRHREGLPVEARPSTWRYRSGKFVRRHRWGVSVAAMLALLLAGYAATVSVQSRRVAAERDRAQATVAFLKSVLSISDPEKGRGGAVPARVLLREGAARLDTSFASQPVLKADLQQVIGSAFRGYGLYEEALQLHRQALTLYLAEEGPESRAVADTRNNIGEELYYLGRPDSAEVAYRQSLQVRRRLLGDHHVDVAQSLNNLALIDGGNEHYARAGERLEEALAIFQEKLPPDHWRIANALHNLAVMYKRQGVLNDAERRYREALAMHQRDKGEKHRDVAREQASLGSVLVQQGRYNEAETMLNEALQNARAATSGSLPLVAYTLFQRGELRRRQGAFAEAERRYRQARARYRQALPAEHRRQIDPLMGLGEALLAQGRAGEALPPAQQALALCERTLPPGHLLTVEAHSLLGAVLTATGHHENAEQHLRQGLRLLHAPTTPRAERIQRKAKHRLAHLYDAWGRPQQAAAWRDSLATAGQFEVASN